MMLIEVKKILSVSAILIAYAMGAKAALLQMPHVDNSLIHWTSRPDLTMILLAAISLAGTVIFIVHLINRKSHPGI
jgi:hypothetical protein